MPSALSTASVREGDFGVQASVAPGSVVRPLPTLDVERTGVNTPLAIGFSPRGHVLFATIRGFSDWDPQGLEKTKRIEIAADALFGAGATVSDDALPDAVSVTLAHGGHAEEWKPNATFSDDGAFMLLHADNSTFAQSKDFKVQKFNVHVVRTATGETVANWAKTLKIESSPEYAFQKSLSPSGRFLLANRPYQLEVFDVATGKNLLHRSDSGPSDAPVFLTETTILTVAGGMLRVTELPSGRILASQSHANTYSLSKDRTRIAILHRAQLRLWAVSGTVQKIECKLPACDACTVEWVDSKRIRVFDERLREAQTDCDVETGLVSVRTYVQPTVFQGEGFSIVEVFKPGAAQPSRAVLTFTKTGKELPLGAGHMNYSASHGHLLIADGHWRLLDELGTMTALTQHR